MTAKLCRACCRRVANRARGLCWHCYYLPGLRDRFAPVSPNGRRGAGFVRQQGTPEPTDALPGTPEKVEILAERAAKGYDLWHPLDGIRK